MIINFLGSYPRADMAPVLNNAEFAFVGRSNVGKSSLINALVNRKNLARTSSTPGKTQLINLFDIDNKWILADLPGYGYARTSKTNRQSWGVMIDKYLTLRPNLATAFILIDSRIPTQSIDIERVKWMAEKAIPFSIVFTKADKQKSPELISRVESFTSQIREFLDDMPNVFVTSSEKRQGLDDLLEFILHVSEVYHKGGD